MLVACLLLLIFSLCCWEDAKYCDVMLVSLVMMLQDLDMYSGIHRTRDRKMNGVEHWMRSGAGCAIGAIVISARDTKEFFSSRAYRKGNGFSRKLCIWAWENN